MVYGIFEVSLTFTSCTMTYKEVHVHVEESSHGLCISHIYNYYAFTDQVHISAKLFKTEAVLLF